MVGMPPEVMTVVYGLLSAASYGSGDFFGGLTSKKQSVYSVVVISQIAGLILFVGLGVAFSDALPTLREILFAMAGGACGAVGLMSLYTALSRRNMGLTAPLVGVISAVTPVIFAVFTVGLPEITQLIGFACGLLAVWLIAGTAAGERFNLRDYTLPIRAGIAFGLSFILYAEATQTATFTPLAFARVASLTIFLVYSFLTKQSLKPQTWNVLPVLAFIGVLDALGNLFYVLAKNAGRIDVASVVSALYPMMTVLLAWVILKEKLSRVQWLGVVIAMIAIVLIVI